MLVTLWAMLVAPSTCGSGLLEHACADDAQDLCHHENDCPTDPCNLAGSVTAPVKSVDKVKVALPLMAMPLTLQLPLDGPTPVPADPGLVGLSSQAASLPLIC
jgi:hypothetical protein